MVEVKIVYIRVLDFVEFSKTKDQNENEDEKQANEIAFTFAMPLRAS